VGGGLRVYLYVLFCLLLFSVTACSKSPELKPLAENAAILAFGDSLTAGSGAGPTTHYPAQLEALIGRKVVNAGIPGELSQGGRKRLPAVLDRHKPRLLILCHGGNDILGQVDDRIIADNIRAMVKMGRERDIDVVLIGVPRLRLGLTEVALYREIAKDFNIPYDGRILRKILSTPSLKFDHVHPNADGYKVLAEAVRELLVSKGAVRGKRV